MRSWVGLYRSAALFVANVVLVLIVANVLLAFLLPRVPAPGAKGPVVPGSAEYAAAVRSMAGHPSVTDKARFFPTLSAEDLAALALETWVLRGYRYEPWVQFREGPYRGRFVNVTEHGFRTDRAGDPWPPDATAQNVFLFGGSTAFGYGLPDDEAPAQHLERYLSRAAPGPVRVYNFAAGYYFSTQERVLFEQLLTRGVRPALAVFLDGLNDFYNVSGEPEFTPRVQGLWAIGRDAAAPGLAGVLWDLPLGRAARLVRERLSDPGGGRAPVPRAPSAASAPALVERAIARFRDNQRIIEVVGAAYGVPVVVAWQPVPTWGYDLAYHAFAPRDFGPHERSRLGYPRMATLYRGGALGPSLLWCADLQRGLREPLYLDTVHYTPRMSRRVARCLAKGIVRRALLRGGGR